MPGVIGRLLSHSLIARRERADASYVYRLAVLSPRCLSADRLVEIVEITSPQPGSLPSLLGASGGSGPTALLDSLVTPTLGDTSIFGPSSLLSFGDDPFIADMTSLVSAAYSTLASSRVAPVKTSKAEVAALNDAFDQMEAGQYDEARESLNGILSDNPRSGQAVQALGLIALAENDTEQAEKLFRRADFLAPNRGYATDAENARVLRQSDDEVLERARLLVSDSEQRGKGVELLMRLVDRSPGNAEAKLLLGEGLIATKRLTEGISHVLTAIDLGDETLVRRVQDQFAKLAKLAPKSPEYRGVLARTNIRLGDFKAALANLDEAERLAGEGEFFKADRVAAMVGIGREYLDRGDVTRAINTLREARRMDLSNGNAGAALGEALFAKAEKIRSAGNLGEAISLYDEAARMLGVNGSESLRKRLAGRAYETGLRYEARNEAMGRDIDKEALAYQAAYSLDKENLAYKRKLAETRNAIGHQFLADENYASAAASYQRAYELYKNDATYKANVINAWRLRGDELLAQGQYDKAIDAYKSAYKVNTNDETSKLALAAAYNARGLDRQNRSRFIEAVRDFKEALRLAPGHSQYQTNYDALSSYDR